MMAITHVLVSLLLLTPIFTAHPEHIVVLASVTALSSVLPDFDLYFGTHRKTLHSPILIPVLAVVSIATYLYNPTLTTALIVAGTASMAAHSLIEIIGGGLEDRPWEQTSTKGVYAHTHQRWIRPRFWIPYDGSPHDFALAATVAALTYYLNPPLPYLTAVLLAALSIAALYTLLRKFMPRLEAELYYHVPPLRRLLTPPDDEVERVKSRRS